MHYLRENGLGKQVKGPQRLYALGLFDGIHQEFNEFPIGGPVGKMLTQRAPVVGDGDCAAHGALDS